MIIWKNKYAYFGTDGNAIGYDANEQFEIVVEMGSVNVRDRDAENVPKTKQNEQRMKDAEQAFNGFASRPNNMQVGDKASLTSEATVKKIK